MVGEMRLRGEMGYICEPIVFYKDREDLFFIRTREEMARRNAVGEIHHRYEKWQLKQVQVLDRGVPHE